MRINEADKIREASGSLVDAVYECAGPGTAPDDLVLALREAAQARSDLDDTIAQAVKDAHAAGMTWATLAAALGVSTQAAHKRYRS